MALQESRKRSYEEMGSDSNSGDDIQSEFQSYIQQQCKRGIENALAWWKTVEGIYPQLSKMAKDTFVVPATGSGVERELILSDASRLKGRWKRRIVGGQQRPYLTSFISFVQSGFRIK